MADVSYPQLPTTVWRGVRQLLRRAPRRKLDDSTLAVELGVQQTAAKQYLKQLVTLGLLNEDGSPTELADRWRQDDPAEAIKEVLSIAYPQALLDLAPPDELDRNKIVRWFTNQGLGTGAAGNKAATYMMIAQSSAGDDEILQATAAPRRRTATVTPAPSAKGKKASKVAKHSNGEAGGDDGSESPKQRRPDLNVNIQIHISADASPDQIETIFSSMKRYFDESD